MPINTAPLDGSIVLVCHCDRPTYAPEAAFFGHYHQNSANKPCWRSANSSTKIVCTHWMPLPLHTTRISESILNTEI